MATFGNNWRTLWAWGFCFLRRISFTLSLTSPFQRAFAIVVSLQHFFWDWTWKRGYLLCGDHIRLGRGDDRGLGLDGITEIKHGERVSCQLRGAERRRGQGWGTRSARLEISPGSAVGPCDLGLHLEACRPPQDLEEAPQAPVRVPGVAAQPVLLAVLLPPAEDPDGMAPHDLSVYVPINPLLVVQEVCIHSE